MSHNVLQFGSFKYLAETRSDVGRVRQNNEDSLIMAPEIGLFGVCDGLGGHAAGEVASAIASETLAEMLRQDSGRADQALLAAIEASNQKILEKQREHPPLSGMGTTLSAILMRGEEAGDAWIGHIGDSRIYRLREGEEFPTTDLVAGDTGYLGFAAFCGDDGTFSITLSIPEDDTVLRRATNKPEIFESIAGMIPETAPWVLCADPITQVHSMASLFNRSSARLWRSSRNG